MRTDVIDRASLELKPNKMNTKLSALTGHLPDIHIARRFVLQLQETNFRPPRTTMTVLKTPVWQIMVVPRIQHILGDVP